MRVDHARGRTEKDGVEKREHHGVRAEPECESDENSERQRGRASQRSQGKARILPNLRERLEPVSASCDSEVNVSQATPDVAQVAELPRRLNACIVRDTPC